MKKFARTLILSVSTAAVVLSAMPATQAAERHRHRVERHDPSVGNAIGAGIIGLAIGAIVVGILSDQAIDRHDPNQNPYRRPRPSPDRPGFPAMPAYYPNKAYHGGSLEPWTPGWYQYCEMRYRSFNPAEGTFTTYEGEKRFCIAE